MDIDTLVIGAGQAGLATSFWLTKAGIEHLVVDGRDTLGGSWPDRWDGFRLVSPNFAIRLPGKHYAGQDPGGFLARDEIADYVADYAAEIGAPVRLGTRVTELTADGTGFRARTTKNSRARVAQPPPDPGGVPPCHSIGVHRQSQGGAAACGQLGDLWTTPDEDEVLTARRVVLATGPYQRPKVPAHTLSAHHLHSSDYRRPGALPSGGVLVVGSGQSGCQIAAELVAAGRDVHLALSRCPSAPRRYRGADVIHWLLSCFLHGAAVGVPFPTVGDLPTPAARFGCDPNVGVDPRSLGVRLYGAVTAAAGTRVEFSDDLPARLAYSDTAFDEEFRPLFDAYIAAAGIDAPPDDRPPRGGDTPEVVRSLDLAAAGVRTVIWATGYRADFGWVDIPVFDEWGYPVHERGVTAWPGLYAVGLRWLHSEPSSVLAGVGADAEHVVADMAKGDA